MICGIGNVSALVVLPESEIVFHPRTCTHITRHSPLDGMATAHEWASGIAVICTIYLELPHASQAKKSDYIDLEVY